MTLIKTTLLNGIAVIIKMIMSLGINKVLAIYVGPSGYAALGQFQNAIQMIVAFASGAVNTGVTKYTAEYHDDELKQHTVWRTAGTIAFFGSLMMAIGVAVFSQSLAVLLLKSKEFSGVFLWFAASIVCYSFNGLLLAILNGKKEIRRFVVIGIVGSLFSLVVTAIMSKYFGLYGALLSLAISQSLSFFVTFILCYRTSWFKLRYMLGGIDKDVALNLTKYTLMALTSALCLPISQILIRNQLGADFGWNAVGYWEAVCRLSNAYLLVITATLTVYYLPKLSELKSAVEIKKEIIQGYKIILPITALGGLIVYLLRDFIVTLLFTKAFSPMRDLFAWQMVGDTVKVGSFLLAHIMLAKVLTKTYIITEIIFSGSLVLLVKVFTLHFGLQGSVIAYTINYTIYWVLIAILVRDHIFLGNTK